MRAHRDTGHDGRLLPTYRRKRHAGCHALAALLVAGALPRLAKVWPYFLRRRPQQPPPAFPVWPLWYAALAWLHVRQAGALLVVGLAIGAWRRAW
ncbi:Putative 1%2C4-Dihydroxy-2-naphtoate prenyltransferase (part2) [Mycobacterium tuberculosis]|uniref:Prenyltransferase n=1 Tax=Mycobacterium tuberculosis TaxID=1773 RepID=A0A0E7ZFA4_MYCTX|nr:hypothetical protein RN03_0515 [Mycobacterium tuberculosis]AMC49035.1 hypothetical protein RN06_0582 [Mycobacterium tuberculosis variant bovis BCG]AMC53738.1 hypothetical protein RN07_0507 [Mycobacterium tuberculosis variant bovis]AMC57951.1 hypothetical protein RN08_0524 [Mycobacterium tuberculosis variant microti]EGB30207.1 hypothetical protein TMMG_03232 [Mycobacterium tuberculosis CDC1551A]